MLNLLPSRRSPSRTGRGGDEPETQPQTQPQTRLSKPARLARLPASLSEPEQTVLERLAHVTAELNDPWAAARTLFAVPPPGRDQHTE